MPRTSVLTVTAAAVALTALAGQPARPDVAPAAATAPAAAAPAVAQAAVRPAPARAAAARPARQPARRPARRVAAKPAAMPKPAAPAAGTARAASPRTRVYWDGRAFATPEAAMRFLVAAYNGYDDVAIKHVTTPDARGNLLAMREIAPALALTRCTKSDGAYDCFFTHSTPRSPRQTGYATFRVAPATRPGWYMTVLADCGE